MRKICKHNLYSCAVPGTPSFLVGETNERLPLCSPSLRFELFYRIQVLLDYDHVGIMTYRGYLTLQAAFYSTHRRRTENSAIRIVSIQQMTQAIDIAVEAIV